MLTSTTKIFHLCCSYLDIMQNDTECRETQMNEDTINVPLWFCFHRIPTVGGKSLDLYRLFLEVTSRGGLEKVCLLYLIIVVYRFHEKSCLNLNLSYQKVMFDLVGVHL